MTTAFPIDQIKANPYQTRLSDDAEHINGIAESIKTDGLLQVPLARRVNGHVELAFGHTRFSAWQIAKPGEPFPLELRELSDRQMSDMAAAENGRRKNLSAIETATAIDRRIKDFKLTQLEAAAPFGYSSQGSVSNLLRLLELPQQVQALVQEGKLPERVGRALVTVARVDPALAEKIGTKATKVDAADVDEFVGEQLRRFYEKEGRDLRNMPWDPKWLKTPAPISVEIKAKVGADCPDAAPACAGCQFNVSVGGDAFCARPACYDAKMWMHAELVQKRQAAKLNISVPAGTDVLTTVWDASGNYETHEAARRMVKAAADLPGLRLALHIGDDRGNGYYRRDVLGAEFLMLATVDPDALGVWVANHAGAQAKKALKAQGIGGTPEKAADETEAQRQRRLVQQAKLDESRRAERSKLNAGKWHGLWLLEHVAELVAGATHGGGGLLAFLEREACSKHGKSSPDDDEGVKVHKRLRGEAGETLVEAYGGGESEAADLARRKHIAFDLLREDVWQSYGKAEEIFDWARAQSRVEKLVKRVFGLEVSKLDRKWNVPPNQGLPFECKVCGVFAPGEKITGKDQSLGWRDDHDEVFCPEHSGNANAAAHELSQAQRKGPHPMKTPAELKALLIKRGMRVPKKPKSKK